LSIEVLEASAMRFPRVRLTVRKLMVAVAVVAVLIGSGLEGARLFRLSRVYDRKAIDFRTKEFEHRAHALEIRRQADVNWGWAQVVRTHPERHSEPLIAELVRSLDRQADDKWHRANDEALLAEKYEHAARHPWEPISADPVPLPRPKHRLVTPEM
jgi:hypothetical protein